MTSPSDLRRVLILDVETGGLDPETDPLLEVAVAEYCVTRGLIAATSWLVHSRENRAFVVNGIPVELVSDETATEHPGYTIKMLGDAAAGCQAVVAHNAAFDRRWFADLGLPWICTCDDVEWPKPSTSRSLVAVALAHGVGVVHAHRALSDVMTLVALFDRVRENHDLGAMLTRAMRPKKLVAAVLPYDRKDEAKAKGFRWQPESKQWTKSVFVDDIATLGFDVKEVA